MIRVLFVQILLFSLPFVVFGFYLYFNRGVVNERADWDPRLPVLAAAGAVLAIIGFFAMIAFDQGSTEDVYRPSQMIDGKIVPGRLERPE